MPKPLVPPTELEARLSALRALMAGEGMELALIRQHADLFYFSGTVQDAHLLVPVDRPPIMLVWRVYDRAVLQSPLEDIRPLEGFDQLRDLLEEEGLLSPSLLGLELDVLPAQLFLYYRQKVWEGVEVRDVSPLIRQVRAVKSKWEIERVQAACKQVETVLDQVPLKAGPGVREIDLAAWIEGRLRGFGHPGRLRMRLWNQEIGFTQVLSGPEGAVASWTNTPAGGTGLSCAYGLASSYRLLRSGDPLTVDIGGCLDGYVCDQTRCFCLGAMAPELEKAYDACRQTLEGLEERLVPGAVAGELYQWALEQMKEQGYQDNFMGPPGNQVRFVGHGVGVELDEYPFISKGNPMVIEEGMVVALEPKCAMEGVGMVGLEDTFEVTKAGARRLTGGPRDVVRC